MCQQIHVGHCVSYLCVIFIVALDFLLLIVVRHPGVIALWPVLGADACVTDVF